MKGIISAITLALLTASCTSHKAAETTPQVFNYKTTPQTLGIKPEQVTQMDALLQSFVDDKKTANLTAFIAKDGKVVYANAVGWKDIENKVPASINDYYVLFSQTKAVTTVAFMTLVEKGLVDINDPVAKYFPEISDQVLVKINDDGSYETRPVTTPMTFVHLMAHTSGLGANLAGEARRSKLGSSAPLGFGGPQQEIQPSGQHTGGGNYHAAYLEEEMLALAEYPLGFDPGSQWDYHISTNMLGYLIERISGQPLRDYVKENVLQPLGMDETDWFYQKDAFSRFVKPYSLVEGELIAGSDVYSRGTVSEQQTYAEGAIGLNGPIEDYAKFCQMLLNKGTFNGQRILKPETIELMTTINRLPPAGPDGDQLQFGLGFELYHDGKKPAPAVSNSAYAWGGMMGTDFIIDPENNMIALFYLNMYQRDPLYPTFLGKAYELIKSAEEAPQQK
jgi:CubicO group peptidase (beta-lactamase class C family)